MIQLITVDCSANLLALFSQGEIGALRIRLEENVYGDVSWVL